MSGVEIAVAQLIDHVVFNLLDLAFDLDLLDAGDGLLLQQRRPARFLLIGLESAEREADITARAKEAEQVNARLSHSNARNDKLTDKLKQVIAKYKETACGLKQSQAERDQLQSDLTTAKAELADAEKKNLALYQTNREILETYKKKSGWTALLQKDPFTGIKQVEIESKVEQIEHDMVDELRDSNLDAAQ